MLNGGMQGTTGPGVDQGNSSLEDLGLVDPTSGRAVSTPDWSPSAQPAPGLRDYEDAQPTTQQDSQAQSQPASQWESPDNPYRAEVERLRQGDPQQQATAHLQSRTQQIDGQAAAAFAQMTAGGMAPEQAQMLVGAARVAAISEAQMQADRLALLPAAKREVANRVAREFSLPNAKITPDEILTEGSVEAMRARARTLSESRRGQAWNGRRAAGADRVERGPNSGTAIDYSNLSITDTIKLGILRNQFTP